MLKMMSQVTGRKEGLFNKWCQGGLDIRYLLIKLDPALKRRTGLAEFQMTEICMLKHLTLHMSEENRTEFLHTLRAGKTFCIAQFESRREDLGKFKCT